MGCRILRHRSVSKNKVRQNVDMCSGQRNEGGIYEWIQKMITLKQLLSHTASDKICHHKNHIFLTGLIMSIQVLLKILATPIQSSHCAAVSHEAVRIKSPMAIDI